MASVRIARTSQQSRTTIVFASSVCGNESVKTIQLCRRFPMNVGDANEARKFWVGRQTWAAMATIGSTTNARIDRAERKTMSTESDADEAPVQSRSVVCCGRSHISKFCPNCGKLLGECHSLVTLLHHCETNAGAQERTMECAIRKRNRDGVNHADWYDRRIKSSEKAANKWRLWAALLRELIVE